MRILFTIPHFYQPKRQQQNMAMGGREPIHGSESESTEDRVQSLTMCVASLHQTFGMRQAHAVDLTSACNDRIAASVEIVICTTRGHHLLHHLPQGLFTHHQTNAEPRLLGYECHAVLADSLGQFDYYVFLEDDIMISDALFFWKQAWFNQAVGDRAVLQPHRFELSATPPIQKLYIDGRISDPDISPRFQNKSVRPYLRGRMLGTEVGFERVDNPHAGCFFLTGQQMKQWAKEPYFLDRATDFWGPLESAATLGVMRTFEVYKPALANAGVLEVHHLENRYLGRLLRFPPDFVLRAKFRS
jgi:hypothetical protein